MRMCAIIVVIALFAAGSCAQNAVFAVPFEISFEGTNGFDFSMNHLEHFLYSSSVFFGVNEANVSIAFIKEGEANNNYIDVGLAVSVISLDEEKRIRGKEMDEYRTNLSDSCPAMPTIIGMDLKFGDEDCASGQYSTFYHYDVHCQWLCDDESFYVNETNQCHAIPTNATSIIQTVEGNTRRFIVFGYIGSAAFSFLLFLFFGICVCIKKRKSSKSTKKSKNKKQQKPKLDTRESKYFYDDEDASEEVKPEQIALSVKSTRSNSVDPDALQSPNTQNERIFAEATLAPLENIKCDEKKKKIMIEQARLEQFKLMDALDDFRKKQQQMTIEDNEAKSKLDDYKKEIKGQLMEIKNKTKQKLMDLVNE